MPEASCRARCLGDKLLDEHNYIDFILSNDPKPNDVLFVKLMLTVFYRYFDLRR